FDFRKTTVWYQSEPLTLDRAPITTPIWSASYGAGVTSLTLDRMVLGLTVGQSIAWTGTTTDENGVSTGLTQSELVTVTSATHTRGYTTVNFSPGLASTYVRSTILLNANVAPATHGETVTSEILGSGDGSQLNQSFKLARV